jgi:hypothetical protein
MHIDKKNHGTIRLNEGRVIGIHTILTQDLLESAVKTTNIPSIMTEFL